MEKTKTKYLTWPALTFMGFSTVWSFGNVANGFIYFNGMQVIFSWILMFLLYFVPYALMVGELGSAFQDAGGGVSSWIHKTIGPKWAYYAGWTYWACHVAYISSKSSAGLKALSWMVFQNGTTYDTFPTTAVQLLTLAVLLFFCWVVSKGLNPLKKLATLAGSSMFVMSLLYILMMFAAPVINPNASFYSADFSLHGLLPQFNLGYFTSLSILVFAVGSCEKISPYVSQLKNPAREFPKGMIVLAIMVIICAIFGTVAMSMMFDPALINESTESFNSYVANGAYMAFQKLGAYYHVGNLLLIIYAACNAIGQFSTLVISIDAPLRMLLDSENSRQFVPSGLLKKNKNGAYINGIWMVIILSGSLILIQSLGPGAASVLAQLTKLNSVVMPFCYMWVFVAYLALQRFVDQYHPAYRFTKNKKLAYLTGGWCLFVTGICCLMGVYVKGDAVSTMLNIITPIVLVALGLILPGLKKLEMRRKSNAEI